MREMTVSDFFTPSWSNSAWILLVCSAFMNFSSSGLSDDFALLRGLLCATNEFSRDCGSAVVVVVALCWSGCGSEGSFLAVDWSIEV